MTAAWLLQLVAHRTHAQRNVLCPYLAAVNRLAAATGACRVAALDHEVTDDAVELQAGRNAVVLAIDTVFTY
jgi:uncharacterized Fe-S radical SAM superfamily protein PflX